MSDSPSRIELAEDRTDLAEDRTLLANERTFSGWARTALATVGIGVGFNALFRTLDPSWVPKAIATLFILLGLIIIIMADRRACAIQARLSAHKVQSLKPLNVRIITATYAAGAVGLVAALWALQ
jgi:putative membrane protein